MPDAREMIVKRVAAFFEEGDLGNLGIGMPTLVANHIPADKGVMLQSENGLSAWAEPERARRTGTGNAGGTPVTICPAEACFDTPGASRS
jgi:acetate CoA/acetoacetate CoA-transferase beta subunit